MVGAVALSADRLVLRRLNYEPEATIVATIGLLYIIQQVVLMSYGPDARPVQAPFSFRILFPWFGYSGYKLVVVAASAILLLATWFVLTRTRLGLVMRATQYDRETAQAFGIPVDRVYAAVFALRRRAGRHRRRADRADPAGALPDGARSRCSCPSSSSSSAGSAACAAPSSRPSSSASATASISVFFSPTLAKIIATLLVALVLVFRPQGLFGGSGDERPNVRRALLFHLAVIAVLFALQFVLPAYHHANLARIMVLAVFAMGYNLLFGYTGLLSLGHAMFFAAGLYGAGLTIHYLGWPCTGRLSCWACSAGAVLAIAVGLLALRTSGVAFMIVTMMFAQVCYLAILYFGDFTRGDEGFVLTPAARRGVFAGLPFDLSRSRDPLSTWPSLLVRGLPARRRWPWSARHSAACWSRCARTRSAPGMLGYDTFRYKLLALTLSGAMAGAAGAAYVLLFGYVGSTFASDRSTRSCRCSGCCSAAPAPSLGPFLGTLLMFYIVEFSSDYTSAYLLVVGVVLVLLVLFFPKGVARQPPRAICAMAAVTLLSTQGLSRHFGGLNAVEQCRLRVAGRRDPRRHRPERRRQDDAASA